MTANRERRPAGSGLFVLLAARVRSVVNRRSTVLAAVLLLTLARSAVLVFWEGSHFDSNQAVFGLMAKHVAERRAFPVFMYGQNYMLAVEAWLAAPVFLVAGASVTALKLPLLAINLVVAWLLVRVLVGEAGLSPMAAGLATVFFVLPGPGTAARLLEASGGTLEPFLYVLLLWLTRDRPAWCGLVLGVGFMNREFTIYGFLGVLILGAARGTLVTRAGLRRLLTTVCAAATVWVAVQVARPHGSAMGPGTTPADLYGRSGNLVEVADRLCLDLPAVPRGFLHIATIHWPRLFATEALPLREFDIESQATQGGYGAGLALGVAMLLALVRIAVRLAREKRVRVEHDVCAYLVLVGVLSVSGYVIGRCGVIAPVKMRYDMLSIVGAVGLAAWYLRIERSKWLRVVWVALVVWWAAVAAIAHGRLWSEYLNDAPPGGKRLIVRQLDARGIRYGIASYATAYPVAFLSDERIIVASSSRVRILAYQAEFEAHRAEAVGISRTPCAQGTRAMAGVYFCPP